MLLVEELGYCRKSDIALSHNNRRRIQFNFCNILSNSICVLSFSDQKTEMRLLPSTPPSSPNIFSSSASNLCQTFSNLVFSVRAVSFRTGNSGIIRTYTRVILRHSKVCLADIFELDCCSHSGLNHPSPRPP